MKKSIMSVLLLAMLAAMPSVILAQNKAWATLSNGVLTFSYGAKPTKPSQTSCSGCGKKISNAANYCSYCGTKNVIDFVVFEVPLAVDRYTPWHNIMSKVEKVVFNVSFRRVTNIKSLKGWFDSEKWENRPRRLTSIVGLENLNTSNVTDMSDMFHGCESLSTIDLSHFNTSKVTNMSGMFHGCESLSTIDLSHFNTSKVTNMSGMFKGCKSLSTINLSHFNTSNVTYMGWMFSECKSLSTIDLSHFNTSKVTSMSGMFGH